MATLEEILGPTLAGQARLKPPPDDLRGLILASKNVWVPIGVESVEEWLVANWKPPVVAPAVTFPPAAPPRVSEPRIEVECTEEGTETGTCRFSRGYTARGTISIPVSQLHSLIREAGSREEAIEAFEEWAIGNHNADDYDYDDEETSNYEAHDSERDESDSNARSVIEAYLDEHPELLEPEEEEETEQQAGVSQLLITAPDAEPPPVAEDLYQSEDTNPMPF